MIQQLPVFALRCDGCGSTCPEQLLSSNYNEVARLMCEWGWRLAGETHYCPACAAARGDGARMQVLIAGDQP